MSLQAGTTKPSPWAKIPAINTDLYSLTDVMSEQLACDLQLKEGPGWHGITEATEASLANSQSVNIEPETDVLADIATQEIDNDYLIAQLLQLEIDKQYDEELKRQESVINRNSHGTEDNGLGMC